MLDYAASNYERVPWEDEELELAWLQADMFLRCMQSIRPGSAHRLLQEHAQHADVCFVYFSNRIEEKGLPLTETMQLVNTILSADHAGTPPQVIEAASPGDRGSRREAVQHAAALKFMRQEVIPAKQLSNEQLQHMHRIMMTGMTREDGVVVQAGSYRTDAVSVGWHLFPPPSSVPWAIDVLLAQLNTRLSDAEENPFALAAWLSYEFVMIHPYQDGNGRMCRLLLSMVLLMCGVPFSSALGFSSGHKQSKQQYLWCLRKARLKGGRTGKLATVVLCGFCNQAASFFETLRVAFPDEYEVLKHML